MISINQLCQAIEWGLRQEAAVPGDTTKKIQVKRISLINDTALLCEFIPYSNKSLEIKTEIGFIMAFLSAFFKDNPLAPSAIQQFTVSAITFTGEQILYALSSLQAAEHAAQGRPIEWLRNTIFQDNSDSQRLLIAKTKISEIENTLRTLIVEVLSSLDPQNWWTQSVAAKIRASAESAYYSQHNMKSTDGMELIHYTYLRDLKTIVVDNWSSFQHIFSHKAKMETAINRLNKLRRDEAHNRPITSANIQLLEQIYHDILGDIAKSSPHLVTSFLDENWRQRITDIISSYAKNQISFNLEEHLQLDSVVAGVQQMSLELGNVEQRLASVTVTPGKRELHNELISIIKDLRSSFDTMVEGTKIGNIDTFKAGISMNEEARKKMRSYMQKYLLSVL